MRGQQVLEGACTHLEGSAEREEWQCLTGVLLSVFIQSGTPPPTLLGQVFSLRKPSMEKPSQTCPKHASGMPNKLDGESTLITITLYVLVYLMSATK